MSICPVCKQNAQNVFRCSECKKVRCNNGLARGTVKLGCVAKFKVAPAQGSTCQYCKKGKWQRIN